jgi:hypothetical protein
MRGFKILAAVVAAALLFAVPAWSQVMPRFDRMREVTAPNTDDWIAVVDGVIPYKMTVANFLKTQAVTTLTATTFTGTNIDAGASGTAGTVDIFPGTASKGKIAITASNNAGDTTTTIVNASQAGARTYTIPDAGGAADFVMNAGAQTIAGVKTFTSPLATTSGIGAAAGTGVAATSEQGDGIIHKTVLTFTNVTVALTDVAGQVAYMGIKVYDFPEGALVVQGAVSDLDVTKSSAGVNDDWDGDFALGSATAGADNDLTSTEIDILTKTSTPQAVAGVTTANGANASIAFLNGAGTAKDCYLNVLVDDADHDVNGTPCNLIFNGTVTLVWINCGDY